MRGIGRLIHYAVDRIKHISDIASVGIRQCIADGRGMSGHALALNEFTFKGIPTSGTSVEDGSELVARCRGLVAAQNPFHDAVSERPMLINAAILVCTEV